jgi:hypothetical protein
MDALRIIAQYVVLRDVIDTGDWSSFPVTFSAENRNIHFVGPRPDIAGRQDVMVSMALAASRSIRSTSS